WEKQLDGKQAAQINLDAVKGTNDANQLRNAEQLMTDGADKPFLSVYFSDVNRGWIVGAYGLAFATEDGGKHWQSIISQVENPKLRHLYGIQAVNGKIYFTGEQGTLLSSSDGHKFSAVKTPYAGTYFGLVGGAKNELVVYGLRGNVYRSEDGGSHWDKVDLGLPVTVTTGLRLNNGNLLLADETGRVLQSRDGGRSFKPVVVPKPSYFSSLAATADGGLALSCARGMARLDASSLNIESK
ncbi:MAG TPA: YCF48-related protein, partial [Rhodocyclaceae bacterium]|nr:YCF48-related protein [Rhodocyclaceae bacterium]